MAVVAPIRERRSYPRVPCQLFDSRHEAIHNISQTGLYLESPHPYPAGSELKISFFVPPEDLPLRIAARVIRRETLVTGGFGYGLSIKDLGIEEFGQIRDFFIHQTGKTRLRSIGNERDRTARVFFKTISVRTQRENLTKLDPRLAEFVEPADYFYLHDLTKDLRNLAEKSGIVDGLVTVQLLHTSACLCVNELDEPMLLMDIAKKLRNLAPKGEKYFHNSPMREVNLCDDETCDQNGDAHLKATLFGHPSVSLILREGKLVLGQWQRVALLEFDGPREREVLVQVIGV